MKKHTNASPNMIGGAEKRNESGLKGKINPADWLKRTRRTKNKI
jgi:hypothetical protein